MLGSPMYMSPEQARGLKSIDHRADIWSLGVVMHQLLTGRVPHQDIDGLGELIITICSEPPVLVNESAPWISQTIADVIAGALQLSTSERYQDATAFADALRECIEGEETIRGDMIVELTDEQKNAPPTEPEEPTASARAAAAAAAQGKFVAHDATVALEDVEAEMEKARAALESAVGSEMEDGPDTQTIPVKKPGAEDPNLAATMALPDDFEMPDIPDEPVQTSPAKGTEPQPDSTDRKRDEQVLAKHRQAQRAAIEAARLGPPSVSDSSGSSRMILAIVIGVLIGGGLLAAYYFKTRSSTSAPSGSPSRPTAPSPAPSETAAPSGEASTEAESQAPSAEASGEPAPSASAATTTSAEVKVFPAYAAVQIDNQRATVTDGHVVIEGEPGSKHQVRVSANGHSKVVTVSLTEKGPIPNIVRAPTPRPKASASP
jgi:serine/threonine-protein kinase